MRKVALTGGIATGKSYVLARIKARGTPTIDADDIVHDAMRPGTVTTRAIAAQFGSEFLKPDGSVDRARLGAKVFADPAARSEVEAVVHPLVYATIQRWFDSLAQPVGVASIPLLYETAREKDFDFVAVTLCPPDVQLRRLLERDRMSEEEAHRRIAAQIPGEEKAARADFVILTGGTLQATDQQVDELIIALGRVTAKGS
jgi:dephospho-CoA kinase